MRLSGWLLIAACAIGWTSLASAAPSESSLRARDGAGSIELAQAQPPVTPPEEEEEGEWDEEEPADTLGLPQDLPPPPSGGTPETPSSGPGSPADSTRPDSTLIAPMLKAEPDSSTAPTDTLHFPAPADTLHPGSPPAKAGPGGKTAGSGPPPPPPPTPKVGLFGIHPVAILIGLVAVHYFVIKAVSD